MFSLLFVVKTWHIYTYMIYVHVLVLTIWLSNIHSLHGLEKLCIKLCIYFLLKLVSIWSTVCFIHHTEKLKSCHILHFLYCKKSAYQSRVITCFDLAHSLYGNRYCCIIDTSLYISNYSPAVWWLHFLESLI